MAPEAIRPFATAQSNTNLRPTAASTCRQHARDRLCHRIPQRADDPLGPLRILDADPVHQHHTQFHSSPSAPSNATNKNPLSAMVAERGELRLCA